MTIRSFRNLPCTVLALAGVYMQPILANAQTTTATTTAPITIAPFAPPAGTSYVIQPSAEAALTPAQKLKLIQQNIKYVFVLFQENRAYDFYFGSYPGAEGLYQHADGTANTSPAGYNQPFVTSTGAVTTIHPFKIPVSVTDINGKTVNLYPNSLYSTDHSHAGMNKGIDYTNGVALNDGYALDNEGVSITNGVPSKTPTLAAEQEGEVAISHIDCDVAPFLWTYADKFTMFDNFHQTIIGPSTPNALAMIAGQSGETQWVEHPSLSSLTNTTNYSLPVVADPDPYWGSAVDTTPATAPTRQPEVSDTTSPASNLTFATLPLSFMGNQINAITAQDLNPAFDLMDVQADIEKIQSHRVGAVNWGWYQEGYNTGDYPPNSPGVAGAGPNTANGAPGGDYIAHHNAPQYFGYVSNNPAEQTHLHGLADFFTAMNNQSLPSSGVFYVRGGYNNIAGLKPYLGSGTLAASTAGEQVTFAGNDDHPGYSDSQVAESLLAQEINAIASSPYWSQSAIVITYDETDGEYDHGAINNRELDPEGNPLAQGPRIPAIVISPYGVSHAVSHVPSEHGSVIRFIDEVFNLIPLADLPDEYAARQTGLATYGQANLGPSDDFDGLGDLTEAFDNNRLMGTAPVIPASYAMIPAATVTSLPHYGYAGCSTLGITTTDVLQGVVNPIPADFNPRPATAPGVPTSGTWVP